MKSAGILKDSQTNGFLSLSCTMSRSKRTDHSYNTTDETLETRLIQKYRVCDTEYTTVPV